MSMKYNLNRGNRKKQKNISCHLPDSIKEVVLRILLLIIYYCWLIYYRAHICAQ